MAEVQPLVAPGDRFTKDCFVIVIDEATVKGRAQVRVGIRPKVEFGHLMRRRHGRRRARVRGRLKVAVDVSLLRGAVNLAPVRHARTETDSRPA